MRRLILVMVMAWAAGAAATGLDVAVGEAGSGAAAVVVEAGSPVAWELWCELDDDASQGLALVVVDLEFDGGPLSPAAASPELPGASFTPPLGYSPNPAGFGGTPNGNQLLQVGGAQNVFAHGRWQCDDDLDCPAGSSCDGSTCSMLSGFPEGELITGVAQPGAPLSLASGILTAPAIEGIYTLRVIAATANVVTAEANGVLFWETEAATPGELGALTVTVFASTLQAPAIPTQTPLGVLVAVILLAAGGLLVLRRGR